MKTLLSLLLLFLCATSYAQSIGNPSESSSTDPMGADYIIMARHMAPTNMAINDMKAKVVGAGNYKTAVYADSGGNPGALITVSPSVSCTTDGWYSFPLTEVNLSSGSYYWLSIWADNNNAAVYYNGSGTMKWGGPFTYGNWPSSVTMNGDFWLNYCMYADYYAPTPPPPPPVTNQAVVTLAWDASPSTDVTGYKLYYGIANRTYTNNIDVGNVLISSISNLVQQVTYYFAATAYNSNNLESIFSDELAYTIPTSSTQFVKAPHPSGLRVVRE